ncbi:MAG: 16S rRNA (cytidine1402-2'-O)-methyltransferase [Candidatus Deianiraeaceae bacterium]|jgi:16S rRNA (cytidine1402-2'-O)-methyltransferase
MNSITNGIYIVSTPIGNIKDITIHAIECLTHADVIFCEDTRKTHFLLNHYNVKCKKLLIFNEHQGSVDDIINLAKANAVVIVSDAGTPLVCDPGYTIIHNAHIEQIPITIVPGACALIASSTLCGMNLNNTLFLGFFHKKIIFNAKYTNAIYIAPHDLHTMFEILRKYENKYNISLSIAREVTKKFQEYIFFDNIKDAIKHFMLKPPKGEFTCFIQFITHKGDVLQEINAVLKDLDGWENMKTKTLAKFLHKYIVQSASTKEIYSIVEDMQMKKD